MKRLKIEIIGLEDNKQKRLMERITTALDELGIEATLIPIINVEAIMDYGIIQTPAWVIRNQILSQGFVPETTEIKRLIMAFLPDESLVTA